MKNGGSWSTNNGPFCLWTPLLDLSNQVSALLLSPELPLPARGFRLEGESDARSSCPLLLADEPRRLFVGAFTREEAACSNETD